MSSIEAILKLPHDVYTGNLLWSPFDVVGRAQDIASSLESVRNKGYWASPIPRETE